MLDRRSRLVEAVNAARLLTNRAESRPLDYIRWTPPQLAHLNRACRRKLLRAGNQIGKTTVGLAEVVWWATGTHPYLPTIRPPVEIWIVCTTWPQSVAIMRKFWAMLPKNLVRPGTRCEPRYGFGKDNPAVVFLNGSIVRFKTTNQGAEALAGATVHFVLVDEPTDEEIWRELDRRLTRTGGTLAATLTPINRPTEYLRQLVRDGVVEETHTRLTAESLIPVGDSSPMRLLDGTPMDDAWILEQRRMVLPRFAPVVLDGEWEQRLEGAAFESYDPTTHLTDRIPDVDLHVAVGLDYGEGDFRTYTSIVGIDTKSGEFPRIHFLGEVASDGMRPPEDEAVDVLDELTEAGGWGWADVSSAWGDKPTKGRAGRKSNEDMMAALERELRARKLLGKRSGLSPEIRQVKTGPNGNDGSVWRGVEWLHRAMLRPGHLTVHPRCEVLHEAFQKWNGGEEHKDPIDGARYATWPFAMRGGRKGGTYHRLAVA